MTFRCVVLSAALLALLAGQPHAQSAASLSIEDVMTSAQLRVTGVSALSTAQRASLDEWLNDYTEKVVQIAIRTETKTDTNTTTPTASGYAGAATGHQVQHVSSEGRTVELEDGSLWEIRATDRTYTGLWLPESDVTVTPVRTPIGDYKYSLTNKDGGEIALARFLAR